MEFWQLDFWAPDFWANKFWHDGTTVAPEEPEPVAPSFSAGGPRGWGGKSKGSIRGWGRIVSAGPSYYPFGKKEDELEKKKKALEAKLAKIELELTQLENKPDNAKQALVHMQALKQSLLNLFEQIAVLEQELAWIEELREKAERDEIQEVMEIYLASRH